MAFINTSDTKLNPLWTKVAFFALVTFFIFLADSVLSFWAPNLMSDKLGSPFIMGLVFSFSSIVGLLSDLILPQIIKNLSFIKMLFIACFLGIMFALLLVLGLSWPQIAIFLLAMAIWGIYYEFLSFADQEFVTGHIPFDMHASVWGILGVFKNLAYFLGPLLAPLVLLRSEKYIGFGAILMSIIALMFLYFFYKVKPVKLVVDVKKINILDEIAKWKVLFTRIWPVITLSFVVGLIDSFFWTSGAVLTEDLARQSFWGGWFLSLYMLPSLFVGFAIARWRPYQGKKKLAEYLFLISGVLLFLLGHQKTITLVLLLGLFASTFIAIGYPLIQAVISDFLGRMGKSKRHLLGFSASSISLGYILGPTIAGFISSYVGEKLSFSYLGVFVVLVSFVLLFLTPKKIDLPQTEINNWESPDLKI